MHLLRTGEARACNMHIQLQECIVWVSNWIISVHLLSIPMVVVCPDCISLAIVCHTHENQNMKLNNSQYIILSV